MTLQQGTELIESFIKQLEGMQIATEKHKSKVNPKDKAEIARIELRQELLTAELGDLKHILEALRH